MAFVSRPAYVFETEALARLFAAAFADYLLPFHMPDAASLAAWMRANGVDLVHSRVLCADEAPVGFAFMNVTGGTARVASFGVVPAARGLGTASTLVETVLAEARARGERRVVLEVLEQNERAVKLYARHDFRVLRRLLGWQHPAGGSGAASAQPLVPVDDAGLESLHDVRPYPAVPWQISSHARAKLAPTVEHLRNAGGSLLVSRMPAEMLVRGLVPAGDPPALDALAALVRAAAARHPSLPWRAPQLYPEEWSPVFEGAGFERLPLNQLEMHCVLTDPAPPPR